MTGRKAKYITTVKNRYDCRYLTHIFEYRGVEYSILNPTSWNCSTDYIYGYMRPVLQHERAQKEIDSRLDNEEKAPEKYTGESEKALNNMMSYFNS